MTADLTPLDVLREQGWLKGESGYSGGRRCLVGAASQCLDSTSDFLAFARIVDEIVTAQFPERRGWREDLRPAASFNDHPDTTFADVELVLEKAQVRYDETDGLQ